MTNPNMQSSAQEPIAENYWPYSERNGMHAESDIAILTGEPDFHLTQQERSHVAAFAKALFDGNVPGVETCASSRDLEGIYQASPLSAQQNFYIGYFRTEKGHAQAEQLGIAVNAADEVIVAQLNDIDTINNFDVKTRKELAADSRKWFKEQLSDALTGDPTDDANWQEPVHTAVHYEPQKLIDKLYDIQAYRRFFTNVRRTLPAETDDHVIDAKRTLLTVYTERVNAMMADIYPHAVNLAEQIDQMPDGPHKQQLESALITAVPIVNAARNDELFAVRMDRIRNGVAIENGTFTPFSKELLTSAEHAGFGVEQLDPQIKSEIITKMDTTEWGAADLKLFLEDVLAQWNLLSSEQITWDAVDGREGFAVDKKWQVVVTPKVKSLSVSGGKRTVQVPDVFSRTLSQMGPAGALPVSAHELAHVLQNEFDTKLADQIPLAAVRGRRSTTLREGGGIYQEQQFQAMLGRQRPVNFHYLRAAQVKESGGTMLEVARAFYNSYIEGKQLSDKALAKARDTAAGNILRFYRHGSYDTQALDYSEQALLLHAMHVLPAEERIRMVIAGGTFNIHDAALLHKANLFEVPRDKMHDPARDVMRTYLEHYRNRKPTDIKK